MKCVVCGQRKGKRSCPAKQGLICAQCCGEKRVVEIACPADCVHLTSGQAYRGIKQYVALLSREENPARKRAIYETLTQLGRFIELIEQAIVAYSSGLRALRDSDVQQAAEAVRKTYETEERGLIFEHSSSNPLAQSLARDLRQRIEGWKSEPAEPEMPLLRNSEAIRCLRVVEAKILYYQEEGSGPRDYLSFISRDHPDQATRSSAGGLIIP